MKHHKGGKKDMAVSHLLGVLRSSNARPGKQTWEGEALQIPKRPRTGSNQLCLRRKPVHSAAFCVTKLFLATAAPEMAPESYFRGKRSPENLPNKKCPPFSTKETSPAHSLPKKVALILTKTGFART